MTGRTYIAAALMLVGLAGLLVGSAAAPSAKRCPGNSCHQTSSTTTTVPTTTTAPQTCTADATQQVLALIAATSDGGTVTFQPGGCYRIEGTIEFRNRHGLTLQGNDATFESFDPPADQRAIWRVWDSSDVTFANMTVAGSYANGGTLDESLQHAHAIDIRNSSVAVTNVTARNVAGDCVYFGLGSSGSDSDSTCTSIGRNGVSVVSGSNIIVQRMHVDRVGLDAFDVEPNANTGVGSSNVRFDANAVGSVHLSVFAIVPNEPLSNLSFTNNTATVMKVDTATLAFRPQTVTATGNTSTQPGHMQFAAVDGLTVTGNSNVTVTETGCTP